VKHDGGPGIGGEFAAFLAGFVGIEHEAALVEALEQHHPHVGQPVGIDGRERHRLRVVRLGSPGLLEPVCEQAERLVGLGKITTP
jgi:hypothetical protein